VKLIAGTVGNAVQVPILFVRAVPLGARPEWGFESLGEIVECELADTGQVTAWKCLRTVIGRQALVRLQAIVFVRERQVRFRLSWLERLPGNDVIRDAAFAIDASKEPVFSEEGT
jgi:hypothetical protein